MKDATATLEPTKRQLEHREALVSFFRDNAGNRRFEGGFSMGTFSAETNSVHLGLATVGFPKNIHTATHEVGRAYFSGKYVACPIGYLPMAASKAKEARMTWTEYGETMLGLRCDSRTWDFLFSMYWTGIDNSAAGAAARLARWAEKEIPETVPPVQNWYVVTSADGLGPLRALKQMCADGRYDLVNEVMTSFTGYDASAKDRSLDAAKYFAELFKKACPEEYHALLGRAEDARMMNVARILDAIALR